MFGWLRSNPKKKLESQYSQKLEQARDVQRNGDIQGYATLMAEAETILQKIDQLAETVDNTSK